jgi:hypothetical protein
MRRASLDASARTQEGQDCGMVERALRPESIDVINPGFSVKNDFGAFTQR